MRTRNEHPWLARVARRARWSAALASLGLVLSLAGLAAVAGYLLGGALGALLALAGTGGLSYVASRFSNRWVLRAQGARPVPRWEAPGLWAILDALSARAGIPTPELWLSRSASPNAMTLGRRPEEASVAVTSGLLSRLDTRGLAGVLAHEVAHIRHRDILLSSFAASVTSLLASAGRLLLPVVLLALPLFLYWAPQIVVGTLLLLVAPLLAVVLQAALSRQRELAADVEAARLTGDPLGLAAALEAIDTTPRSLWELLFGRRAKREPDSLLHSHPRTEERVSRLVALARGALAEAQAQAQAQARVQAQSRAAAPASAPFPRPALRRLHHPLEGVSGWLWS